MYILYIIKSAAKKALNLEKCKFDLFCDDLPNGADCYEYGYYSVNIYVLLMSVINII